MRALTAACAGFFLAIVGCSSDTGTPDPSASSAAPSSAASSATAPGSGPTATPTSTATAGRGTITVGLNQPARVGPLTYTVTALTDLGTILESQQGGSLSNGGFISASVTAQNNDSRPFRLNPEFFTATTAGGQSVRGNISDSIIANGSNSAFRRPISGGASLTGAVVFNFSTPPQGGVMTVVITDSGGRVIVNVA